MKKIVLVLTLVLGTIVSNAQFDKMKIGATTTLVSGGVGYGTFLELNKIGIMYSRIANLSNEDPTDFIYGKVGSYTAGSDINNVVLYHNMNASKYINLITGLGIQSKTDITTSGNKNKESIIYLLGTEFLTNTKYSIRTDVILSIESKTLFNIGIGYKL